MGVYRRKDKDGRPGPFVVQYPHAIDPGTGKLRYTTLKAGFSRRVANTIFHEKMLEWEKKKLLGLEGMVDWTFRELADWYVGLPGTKKLKSAEKITKHCRTLKAHFGNMKAGNIRPHMIESYLHKRLAQASRRGTPCKPATVNREFEVMKRIFNLALREEMVERNPCFKVAKLPEENARDRVLSHTEFLALTEAMAPHAAELVRMGYYTGMRFGEIAGLTWDRVNLKEGYLSLTAEDTKTRRPRRVYLVPQAIEVLERASRVRGISHRHVFTYKGRPVRSLKTALRTALRETGIKNFRFHDLRRTFNTNMQRAGVRNTVTMEMTGHKTLAMFTRYSSVDPNDAREAVAKYASFLDKQGTITSPTTSQTEKGLGCEA